MRDELRKTVVLLLIVAQIALGHNAGRVLCLGGSAGGSGGTCAGDRDGHSAVAHCQHENTRGDWPLPVPAEPHDDDCGCIDVLVPVTRPDGPRAGDDAVRIAASLSRSTPIGFASISDLPVHFAHTPNRPPGPAPGIRTTRLLI